MAASAMSVIGIWSSNHSTVRHNKASITQKHMTSSQSIRRTPVMLQYIPQMIASTPSLKSLNLPCKASGCSKELSPHPKQMCWEAPSWHQVPDIMSDQHDQADQANLARVSKQISAGSHPGSKEHASLHHDAVRHHDQILAPTTASAQISPRFDLGWS